MSTYATGRQGRSTTKLVTYAVTAGVLAGVVFGMLIQFRLERMTAIGAMYTLGSPSLTAGWVAHIFHSAIFGAFFGLLYESEFLSDVIGNPLGAAATGAAYAAGLWAVNIVFVWPLWLNNVGFTSDIPLPNVAVMPLVGHVIWGLLLGGIFYAIVRAT